jgi:DNA-binding transcriptional MerR regulator
VNVGLRIKALKSAAPSEPEPAEEVIAVAPPPPKEASPAAGHAKSTRGRKSIKQTEAEAELIDIPEDEVLFQKHYYSMGEVADMFRVNHSLLRFWENEFDIIQPRKNRKGDRHFRPVDIKNLHLIYHLLRQRKYTIEGAKDFLKNNKKAEARFEAVKKLSQIRNFLQELKAGL